MIDFNANIISGKSIGNILLGENITSYIDDAYSSHKVSYFEYYLPSNEIRLAYIIDKTITIATLSDGVIMSIGCNENYKGTYHSLLHTGQSMREIIKLTNRQRIFNGSIIINDDFGFSFDLPAPYDEIADDVEHIPLDLILKEVRVANFSEWNPRK